MLLVAGWLPASSHALLQYVGLIHERHAAHDADSTGSHEHEHDTDDHDVADGICALSSAQVNVPMPDADATPFLLGLFGLERGSELNAELSASGLAPPGAAPLQLSSGWQFSFRAALPARAPSFVS